MKTRLILVTLAATVTALAGCSSGPASPAVPVAPPSTDTATAAPATGPATVTTTAPAAPGATTRAGTAARPAPNGPARGLVPLWPFTTDDQVRTWQQAYRSTGAQPWHLDPGRTALAFTHDHLGYADVDRVSSTSISGGDARIGVGWSDPEVRTATVAVLHLVRSGTGGDAPWVVVGSEDTALTLDTPRYGAVVSSPLRVGGLITGVDESLRVIAVGPTSPAPLAEVSGLPAGGQRTPWSTTLRFSAPRGTVLTVAVSTGGHLKGVERFAITAVRVG